MSLYSKYRVAIAIYTRANDQAYHHTHSKPTPLFNEIFFSHAYYHAYSHAYIRRTVTCISDVQSRVYRTYSHAYIGRTVTRISDVQSRVYGTYSHAYSNVRLDILTAYVHVLNTYWHCKVLLCFRFLIGFFSRVDIYISRVLKKLRFVEANSGTGISHRNEMTERDRDTTRNLEENTE